MPQNKCANLIAFKYFCPLRVYAYIYVLVKSETWSKLRAMLTFDRSKVSIVALNFNRSKVRAITYVNLTYYMLWVTNKSIHCCGIRLYESTFSWFIADWIYAYFRVYFGIDSQDVNIISICMWF